MFEGRVSKAPAGGQKPSDPNVKMAGKNINRKPADFFPMKMGENEVSILGRIVGSVVQPDLSRH